MANNSERARSVLYGKTIDHVLEQTVLLSDGSIAHFREMPRGEVTTGDSLEAACYRTVLGFAQEHAAEIDRRYPKILRRVGGYNLDEFVDAAKPVNLAKIMVGSEGTLGVVLEAKLRLVPLPKAKAVMVISFADLLESLTAAPIIVGHKPSAVEVMDKSIPWTIPGRMQRWIGFGAHSWKAIQEQRCCVEFYGEKKEDLPPRLKALEDDLRSRKLGYAYHSETETCGTGENLGVCVRRHSGFLPWRMKDDAKSISFVEDTAVAPEEAFWDFIDRFLTKLSEATGPQPASTPTLP